MKGNGPVSEPSRGNSQALVGSRLGLSHLRAVGCLSHVLSPGWDKKPEKQGGGWEDRNLGRCARPEGALEMGLGGVLGEVRWCSLQSWGAGLGGPRRERCNHAWLLRTRGQGWQTRSHAS